MVSDEMSHPKVFISYSHDSTEHADRVLALSDRLRADGIDCILDQYEDSPSVGWPRWMDQQILAETDFVLMICTPTYYRRVMGKEQPGVGLGVSWESNEIYQSIYDAGTSNARFIPALPEEGSVSDIPLPWRGVTYYRAFTEEGYEALYRRLTNQPLTPKPDLGKQRQLPPRQRQQTFVGTIPNEHPTHPVTSESSATGATAEGSAQVPMTQKAKDEEFDVFLCHNSHDKPQVKEIARQLQARGLKPWLDEWQLRPGLPWQRALEAQIEQIKSAAIFVGKNGRGPWQDMELEAFIREFVSRNCPVIPVVLADAPDKPQLPIFLRGMTWVDFRKQNPDPMRQLIWGIEGKNPNVIPLEATFPADGSSGVPIAHPTSVSTSKIIGNPGQLTFQQKSELVNKLLACATMRDGNSRNMVVQELSFAGSISRHTGDRVDVMNIVNTSLNYQDGLQKLVEVISSFEKDASGNESLPMQGLSSFLEVLFSSPEPITIDVDLLNELYQFTDNVHMAENELFNIYYESRPIGWSPPQFQSSEEGGTLSLMIRDLAQIGLQNSQTSNKLTHPLLTFVKLLSRHVPDPVSKQLIQWREKSAKKENITLEEEHIPALPDVSQDTFRFSLR